MKKKYLIFGGEQYYSSGGAYDYLSFSENEQHAKKIADSFLGKRVYNDEPKDEIFKMYKDIQWVQVYCINTNSVIYTVGEKPYNSGEDGEQKRWLI